MIAQREADIAFSHGLLVLVHVALEKSRDGAFSLGVKITMSLAHTVEYSPTFFLEQIIVSVKPMEEVYMETVVERIGWI